MSSVNTPLMSEYPADIKEPVQSELPVYRLDEDNVELAVGAPTKRVCFWKRMRVCQRADGQEKKKRCFAKRLFRFFAAVFLLVGVVGFFAHKHRMNCMMKMHPVTCVPLDEASTTLELPLANWRTHIAMHSSLTGGDTIITHSDDVKEGTVSISFDVPKDIKLNDDEEIPEYYVCHIAGPKFVGAGIHSKDKHVQRVKATSTKITLPASEAGHSRDIKLMGPHPRRHGHKFGMHKRIRKAIRKEIHRAAAMASWTKIEHSDAE